MSSIAKSRRLAATSFKKLAAMPAMPALKRDGGERLDLFVGGEDRAFDEALQIFIRIDEIDEIMKVGRDLIVKDDSCASAKSACA